MTQRIDPVSDLRALTSLDVGANLLTVTVQDRRAEPIEVFADLGDDQQMQLASDAWRVGLRAVVNAYRQAEEAKLADIGKTMREDLERVTEQLTRRQTERVEQCLSAYFDPESGVITERLDAFTREDGELMQQLRGALGPESGLLAQTLAAQLGEQSPLLKRLDPVRKDGVVHELSCALAKVLEDQREATARLLDPMAEDSPIARFIRVLRRDMQKADQDRDKQLKLATAALDLSDPNSLLNRLVKESQTTRVQFLQALNLASPKSPLAAIKTSLTELLREHMKSEQQRAQAADKRQREFEADVRATLERLETKKAHDARSARGGVDFEQAVADFTRRVFSGAPMTVEAVGNLPGTIARCRTGDVVARYTEESSYQGASVVVEAKRDASYTEAKALQELTVARKNRAALTGVFVMARSHAGAGFPAFVRHQHDVIVVWDPEDPQTDAYLHAALLLGQCMAARSNRPRDEGNIQALVDIESRVQAEVARLDKMRKHVDAISSNAQELADHVRGGTRSLGLLLRNANEVLAALAGRSEALDGEEPTGMTVTVDDDAAAAEE